jgi:hypothetical protein
VRAVWRREQEEGQESMEQAVQKAADELIEKFQEQWAPAMENLQEADAAFDDLDGARAHLIRPPRLCCSLGVLAPCGAAGSLSRWHPPSCGAALDGLEPACARELWLHPGAARFPSCMHREDNLSRSARRFRETAQFPVSNPPSIF